MPLFPTLGYAHTTACWGLEGGVIWFAGLRDLRMTGMTELTPCPYLAALDRNSPGLAFNWPLALSASLCYCHHSPPDISRNAFQWNQNLGCHQRPFGHWLSPWGTRYRGATTRAARIKPRIGTLPIWKVQTQMGTAPWSREH